jgi:hypothetical protein
VGAIGHKLGGARLPNSFVILTEVLAGLVSTPSYTKTLAEPRSIV